MRARDSTLGWGWLEGDPDKDGSAVVLFDPIGPAKEAGVRRGDRLLNINDRSWKLLNTFDQEELYYMNLEKAIPIEVLRMGKQETLHFTPQHWDRVVSQDSLPETTDWRE